jgi:hypothetical protein
MSKKLIGYFTINIITTGFVIAVLSSGAIYLDWLGFVNPLINTILGLMMLYWLLRSDKPSDAGFRECHPSRGRSSYIPWNVVFSYS